MKRFFQFSALSLLLLPLGSVFAAASSHIPPSAMTAGGPSAAQLEKLRQLAKAQFRAMLEQRNEMRRQQNAQALNQDVLEKTTELQSEPETH
ncbi:hypothetical protein [Chromatium okenii]|jgi:hypothetical protein|uniref:hypothetical protein n=1 Tax=Chromatium okenii TaxID=61644 RepID=UPI0026EC3D46|nr:hypothetical protein [Chromatium okenii]MBV5309615.1 hypothetical protein [Chromatium okenii]